MCLGCPSWRYRACRRYRSRLRALAPQQMSKAVGRACPQADSDCRTAASSALSARRIPSPELGYSSAACRDSVAARSEFARRVSSRARPCRAQPKRAEPQCATPNPGALSQRPPYENLIWRAAGYGLRNRRNEKHKLGYLVVLPGIVVRCASRNLSVLVAKLSVQVDFDL